MTVSIFSTLCDIADGVDRVVRDLESGPQRDTLEGLLLRLDEVIDRTVGLEDVHQPRQAQPPWGPPCPQPNKETRPMITLQEQIAEAQRELALRRTCYPQWIKAGTLDASEAYYQLQCMEAIVKTLRQFDAEQRQLSLFAVQE